MDDLQKELDSLRTISLQLRVPELKYHQLGGSTEGQAKNFKSLCDMIENRADSNNSLMPYVTLEDTVRQQAELINTVFFADRVFDVWCRKLALEDDLVNKLDPWRFSFLKLLVCYLRMYDGDGPAVNRELVLEYSEFLDYLVDVLAGWSPVPVRSKGVALEFLQECEELISNVFTKPDIDFSQLFSFLESYKLSKNEKFAKIVSRLKGSEENSVWSQYSFWYAQNFVDSVFKEHKLPESLQVFIDNYWVDCIRSQIDLSKSGFIEINPELVKLTYALKEVFCIQSETLFELAGTLVDSLKEQIGKANLNCTDSIWNALESSLVSLLKQEFSEHFNFYNSLVVGIELAPQFGEFIAPAMTGTELKDENHIEDVPLLGKSNSGYDVGTWYVSRDANNLIDRPMLLVASYKYANIHLFVNHVGMKVGLFSEAELNEMSQAGLLKPLKSSTKFSSVFANVLKGLKRVSDTQKKARLEAAEKAKKEAERLLEEQKAAEAVAARKAEEIAKRTQELLKKREDKILAEKQANALKLAQSLSVGAWVKIEGELEERFKLVVKIAASGKYIFVDKLGIRKKEYIEAELVKGIIDRNITCISDGADFEDSLQRVVSRIRVSN